MRTASSLLLLVLASGPLLADSYGPFTDYRQVDPTGRYYLVIKFAGVNRDSNGNDNRVTYEFAERKEGSTPVTAAEDTADGSVVKANPNVCVRLGDKLLCKGSFEHCPGTFIISSSGLGFAGVDMAGHNYPLWSKKLDALVIVSPTGVVRHRKTIHEVLEHAGGTSFQSTMGGTWWSNGGWYDEQGKALILPTTTRSGSSSIKPILLRLDLETGKIEKSSDAEITKALRDNNRGAWNKALELAIELKMKEAQTFLPAIVDDKTVPQKNRLQAAILLGKLGDKQGASLVKEAVLTKSENQQEAIDGLVDLLDGKSAAEVLGDCVRRFPEESEKVAWQAMSRLSAEAKLPVLIKLLDDKPTQETISFACSCLSVMGKQARPAITSLIRVLEAKLIPHHLINSHEFAALVLGNIGEEAKAALPYLIRRAEEYSREEWERVKDKRPELKHKLNDWYAYSDSKIIDAIWKIRKP